MIAVAAVKESPSESLQTPLDAADPRFLSQGCAIAIRNAALYRETLRRCVERYLRCTVLVLPRVLPPALSSPLKPQLPCDSRCRRSRPLHSRSFPFSPFSVFVSVVNEHS